MKPDDPIQTTEIAEESCSPVPMGRAIHLLGDPWILLIVVNLLQRSRRFNELRDLMGHVSPKTLSQRLKTLEELQIVKRHAFLEIPPRVEYSLTEKGHALGEVINAIEKFAQTHLSNPNPPPPNSPCS